MCAYSKLDTYLLKFSPFQPHIFINKRRRKHVALAYLQNIYDILWGREEWVLIRGWALINFFDQSEWAIVVINTVLVSRFIVY